MKLAAMEGLYRGSCGQDLVAVGILKPEDKRTAEDPMLFSIDIPRGLSFLANSDFDSFVPGIDDLIEGRTITEQNDTVYGLSYAHKMALGASVRAALADYDAARLSGNTAAMNAAADSIQKNFRYFGYGYLSSPKAAVPNVDLTFYTFHIMVAAGGYLLLLFVVMLFVSLRRSDLLSNKWLCILGIISIAIVWICSQSGWIVAEVGRQPWVIQDLMPTTSAISGIREGSVQTTFWIFAILFTGLLIAEISIMIRYISATSKTDIQQPKK